jgi:hypothetical protein
VSLPGLSRDLDQETHGCANPSEMAGTGPAVVNQQLLKHLTIRPGKIRPRPDPDARAD